MRNSRWHALLLLALLLSCSESTDPEIVAVPESELTFFRFSADVQPLLTTEGSFWAVKGEGRKLVLRYRPEQVGDLGEEFLEFEVSGNALYRRPDGAPFAEGDSVLITVRVDDANRFLFTFEPAGLVFHPDHPAELEVTYRRADPDRNGDGSVDSGDDELDRRLSLWRQPRTGELWYKLATLRFDDLEEAEAKIYRFSHFALAGN